MTLDMKYWIQLTLVVMALATIMAFQVISTCRSESRHPSPGDFRSGIKNVLLIGIDTCRVDQLGFYGCPRNTTPFLDKIAEKSVVFENAYSPRSLTRPAFTSLLTGIHPVYSGVMENTHVWPDGLRSLVEDIQYDTRGPALHEQSSTVTPDLWYTFGIPACGVIRAEHGFSRGFNYYYDPAPHGQVWERTAEQITEVAMDQIDFFEGNKFFMFMHLWDVHSPYEASDYSTLKLCDPYYNGPFLDPVDITQRELINFYHQGELLLSDEDITYVRDLYDAQIRDIDRELEDFFRWMMDEGYWDNTLVIITADHGEMLGEDHRFFHGRPTEQELHIPLMFHFPGDTGGGTRVEGLVEITDIMPTVLDLLGVQITHEIDGISLLPLMANPDLPGRPSVLAIGGQPIEVREKSIWDGEWRRSVDIISDTMVEGNEQVTAEELEQLRALGYVE